MSTFSALVGRLLLNGIHHVGMPVQFVISIQQRSHHLEGNQRAYGQKQMRKAADMHCDQPLLLQNQQNGKIGSSRCNGQHGMQLQQQHW